MRMARAMLITARMDAMCQFSGTALECREDADILVEDRRAVRQARVERICRIYAKLRHMPVEVIQHGKG